MKNYNLSPKIIHRNKLWFGQFDHSVRLPLQEASALRSLDHAKIDRALDVRSAWGKRLIRPSHGGSWHGTWENIVITPEIRDQLHQIADFIVQWPGKIKHVVTGDWIFLYSNGLDLAEALVSMPCTNAQKMEIVRIDLHGLPNTIMLRQAQHAYRSYLRNGILDPATVSNLAHLLRQQSNIRIGPAFKRCLDSKNGRIQDYYFVDHDDTSLLTMMSLISPDIIRCTLPIAPYK